MNNVFLLELIDILAKPIQDGGQGMADCEDSPLIRLRAKIVAYNDGREPDPSSEQSGHKERL